MQTICCVLVISRHWGVYGVLRTRFLSTRPEGTLWKSIYTSAPWDKWHIRRVNSYSKDGLLPRPRLSEGCMLNLQVLHHFCMKCNHWHDIIRSYWRDSGFHDVLGLRVSLHAGNSALSLLLGVWIAAITVVHMLTFPRLCTVRGWSHPDLGLLAQFSRYQTSLMRSTWLISASCQCCINSYGCAITTW